MKTRLRATVAAAAAANGYAGDAVGRRLSDGGRGDALEGRLAH